MRLKKNSNPNVPEPTLEEITYLRNKNPKKNIGKKEKYGYDV